ncbi:major histocompatibility complex class I-related gene protein-like [Engraulis encrasicolus]|uniref:major histocompatibility complex class I-related gene protein-like n=1 Tax=Engraulis encrasicolus TaxID=184585 RepID=UPI002FD70E59
MFRLMTCFLSFHMFMTLKNGSHSLWVKFTFIGGDTPFPEFSAIVLLDDIQMGYYDPIKKIVYRGAKNSDTEPDTSAVDIYLFEHLFERTCKHMRGRANNLKNYLNHTSNVYVLQRLTGCKMLDDGQTGGLINKDAFNGESGDVRYYNPQLDTFHTDHVWPECVDSSWPYNNFQFAHIYHPTCIGMLKKYLLTEKNLVLKKVKPKVRLLQKHVQGSTVLLTCLATGFYPRHINLTLLRNGQPVPDQRITGGQLLPNGDETYQMKKSLEVSTEELQQHHYTCRAQHLSLPNKLETNLERDWDSVSTSSLSLVLVAVCVCLLGGATGIIMCWTKHRGACCKRNSSSATNSEEMEEMEGITAAEYEKHTSLET